MSRAASTLPALRSALLGLALAACGPAAPGPGRGGALDAVAGWPAPVVLVVIDTLRADHVTMSGYARDTTPYLAELAAHGIVFERAYANASWTRPSMASLWTSRLPGAHGCVGRAGRLADDAVTLPEVLRDAGWDTRGLVANGNVERVFGFAQGFASYRFVKGRPLQPYADAAFLDRAWSELLAGLAAPPFLVYLHLVDPHDPYLPHPEHDYATGDVGSFDGTALSLDPYRVRAPSEPNRRRVIDLYDGEIAFADAQLRRLLGRLRGSGLLDAAWIVVTSDHGEGLWDHGDQGHAWQVYEEQVRVPLLIVPPGGLAEGRRVTEPFPLVDLAPTLLELNGLAPCASFDGRSWVPFLLGREAAPERPIVIEEEVDHVKLAAVVSGRHKLIADLYRGTQRVFDLERNPGEDPSLALDPSVEPTAESKALERALAEALAASRRGAPGRAAASVDLGALPVELRQHLAELGYTGGDR